MSDREDADALGAARRLHAAGHFQAALAACRDVLEVAPANPAALSLCGALHYQLGHHHDAISLLSAAVRQAPAMAGAWQNLVLPLLALGRIEDACNAGEAAVAAAPEAAACYYNLTLALSRAGRLDEAAVAAEAAIALRPEDAGAWALLAGVRTTEGRHARAAALFRRALVCDPSNGDARFGLADALHKGGDAAAAEAAYREALACTPHHHAAQVNLGVVLRDQGRWHDAMEVWQTALASAPQSVELRFNLACAHLQRGDWTRGWQDYELRWAVRGLQPPLAAGTLPRWAGECLPEATLIVHHEQGLGDTIQFLRFVPLALDRVRNIGIVCQKGLGRLLARCPLLSGAAEAGEPRVTVIEDGVPLPRADAWIALMSLPGVLGITPHTLPRTAPYLFAEPDLIRTWASRLATAGALGDGLRVGLHWQGNTEAPGDAGRSLRLAAFAPLADVAGARFFSIQKGFGREQLVAAPPGLVLRDLGEILDTDGDAFVDTAAALHSLDLLITSDTAVAHLAGALGRPVWVLLKAGADWRWGEGAGLSPWYPTMRLFRQGRPGDWAGVIATVAAELTALIATRCQLRETPASAVTIEQAVALHQAGRYAEVAAAYRGHLGRKPDEPHLLNRLAMACCEADGWSQTAVEAARGLALYAAALAPAAADVHSNLGVLLKRLGRFDDAEIAFLNALAMAPGQAAALQNVVNLLRDRDRAEDAVAIAERAVAVANAEPALLAILGDALVASHRAGEAEAAYRRALALAPEEPRHWVALGKMLSGSGRWDAAGDCWERALAIDPDHLDALNNLGVMERTKGDINLALWFYRRALAINARQPATWCNFGIAAHDQGDIEAARQAFETAIALDPAYADAHMALGMMLLLDGDYTQGLADYEWRLKSTAFGAPPPSLPIPAWDGSDVSGKRLLLLAEQGLGDAIQFVRYAAVVKARGAAAVIIGCRPRLARLLARAAGVDAVVREGAPVPKADAVAYLMSAPCLAGTRLDSIPADTPYLSAEPERILHWAGRLAEGTGFRVGVVWQGSTDARVDRGRSLPLRSLAPLAAIEGVRLISLQKGDGCEQLALLPAGMVVESLGEDFDTGEDAFVDCAAVMMNLDLVITTDTAVAHLAGALGRPCWVVLKATPEWRWLRGREDSPWYPTTRLFRQPEGTSLDGSEAWAPVIERVEGELRRLIAGDRSRLIAARGAGVPASTTETVPAGMPALPRGKILSAAATRHGAGDAEGAFALYVRILADDRENAQALDGAGTAALQLGRHRRAAMFLERARLAGLDTPESTSNLALARKGLGDFAGAERLLRSAIAAAPAFGEGRLNLGNLLRESGRPHDAAAMLRDALALLTGRARGQCLRALGNAVRDTGALEPATTLLRRAVAAAPDDAEAHIDLAHALLAGGDYAEGFAEYEWRWRGREMRPRHLAAPIWDGGHLDGRTLLVHGEQGLGDHIQFARFVIEASRRCDAIVFECRGELCRLLRGLTPWPARCTLVAQGAPLPPYDAQIALLSLPRALGVDLDRLPATVPYLRAEPGRVLDWARRRAAASKPLTVGIAWQGNPNARADRGRSVPLALLEPVLSVRGVRFIALQKEHGLAGIEAAAARHELVRPGEPFDAGGDAFLDTAAILETVDLVITTDTAIAHLAGALGRPTWLLLKAAADWRWFAGRTDSPWYPGMRLFRQPHPGAWDAVAADVAAELAAAACAAAAGGA